jgi:hypothetical protein
VGNTDDSLSDAVGPVAGNVGIGVGDAVGTTVAGNNEGEYGVGNAENLVAGSYVEVGV